MRLLDEQQCEAGGVYVSATCAVQLKNDKIMFCAKCFFKVVFIYGNRAYVSKHY